jgi:putative ABC transport system permease protein
MNIRNTVKTSISSLTVNKSRSLLTILGIVIGITAIILVVSVGKGAEGLITGELSGLGSETVVIRPGKEPKGPSDFAEVLLSDSLKERELLAITKEENVPDLLAAAPEILVPGNVSYLGETFNSLNLGFSAEFMRDAIDMKLAEGELFDDLDIRSKARVAVIGSEVKEELFNQSDPLGQSITIRGEKFRVIGVYEPRGQVVFFNVDELVVVPYTSAQAYLSGNDHYAQIIAKAKSPEEVDRMVGDIKRTLRELHNIDDPEDDDFNVQTQQGLVQQVSTIIGVFTIFLTFVVAISLVVGGIGVMNIMLVSVTERTREIGLRKAVGAEEKDIMRQFLFESVIITGVGGIVGIVLGTLLAAAISFVLRNSFNLEWPFSFPLGGAILGLFVSASVGLVFGLYPAKEASKKSPIEALRYE